MNSRNDSLRAALDRLSQCANEVWRLYQQQGAGNLSAELAAPLEEAFAAVEEHRSTIDAAIMHAAETARDISLRCIQRSEGLNFVTGEAGMIPRRDLIEPFTAALERLDQDRE